MSDKITIKGIKAIGKHGVFEEEKINGQNFVVDANTCQKIARLAQVNSSDHVVEIGPGIGSLTLALLELRLKVAPGWY